MVPLPFALRPSHSLNGERGVVAVGGPSAAAAGLPFTVEPKLRLAVVAKADGHLARVGRCGSGPGKTPVPTNEVLTGRAVLLFPPQSPPPSVRLG